MTDKYSLIYVPDTLLIQVLASAPFFF
jgi:hypothetical protein